MTLRRPFLSVLTLWFDYNITIYIYVCMLRMRSEWTLLFTIGKNHKVGTVDGEQIENHHRRIYIYINDYIKWIRYKLACRVQTIARAHTNTSRRSLRSLRFF